MKTKNWTAKETVVQDTTIGGLEVTKIVREYVPIAFSTDGLSYGMLIDRTIEQAMEEGQEIQTMTLTFSPDEWNRLVKGV
jgi:hypothetical protein